MIRVYLKTVHLTIHHDPTYDMSGSLLMVMGLLHADWRFMFSESTAYPLYRQAKGLAKNENPADFHNLSSTNRDSWNDLAGNCFQHPRLTLFY